MVGEVQHATEHGHLDVSAKAATARPNPLGSGGLLLVAAGHGPG
jgi:hypothetical protein